MPIVLGSRLSGKPVLLFVRARDKFAFGDGHRRATKRSGGRTAAWTADFVLPSPLVEDSRPARSWPIVYRIIGLLGRGGMGEVYRADDLKLGQPVALKFLPRALASDPVRHERFFAEVRITRQLSHPNICRVYDIADFEDQHFLSMEYIDGEDLASLIQPAMRLSKVGSHL